MANKYVLLEWQEEGKPTSVKKIEEIVFPKRHQNQYKENEQVTAKYQKKTYPAVILKLARFREELLDEQKVQINEGAVLVPEPGEPQLKIRSDDNSTRIIPAKSQFAKERSSCVKRVATEFTSRPNSAKKPKPAIPSIGALDTSKQLKIRSDDKSTRNISAEGKFAEERSTCVQSVAKEPNARPNSVKKPKPNISSIGAQDTSKQLKIRSDDKSTRNISAEGKFAEERSTCVQSVAKEPNARPNSVKKPKPNISSIGAQDTSKQLKIRSDDKSTRNISAEGKFAEEQSTCVQSVAKEPNARPNSVKKPKPNISSNGAQDTSKGYVTRGELIELLKDYATQEDLSKVKRRMKRQKVTSDDDADETYNGLTVKELLNIVAHVDTNIYEAVHLLAHALYSKEELMSCSVSGKKGSNQSTDGIRPALDPVKLRVMEHVLHQKIATHFEHSLFVSKLQNVQKVLRAIKKVK